MNEWKNKYSHMIYIMVTNKMHSPDLPSPNNLLPQRMLASTLQLSPCRDHLSPRALPCSRSASFLEQPSPDDSSVWEHEGLAISAQLGTTLTVYPTCRTARGASQTWCWARTASRHLPAATSTPPPVHTSQGHSLVNICTPHFISVAASHKCNLWHMLCR